MKGRQEERERQRKRDREGERTVLVIEECRMRPKHRRVGESEN